MLETLVDTTPSSLAQIAAEMELRRTHSLVVVFSMGSQFDHLIVQKVAAAGVFCLVADPTTIRAKDVRKLAPKGIIVSGGPASVHSEPPPFDNDIFDLGIPTLGICLGFQMWAKHVGCKVSAATKREFHPTQLRAKSHFLFGGCYDSSQVLQSHGDVVEKPTNLPGFRVLGSTKNCPVAAAAYKHLIGVQFHLEVSDTQDGSQMIENFCGLMCNIHDRFPARDIAAEKIGLLREKTREDKKVLIALSAGSDSSVCAYLFKAAGLKRDRLKGVYIKGVDRPDDEADLLRFFGNQDWIEVEVVDATEALLDALAGKTGEEKRDAFRVPYKAILEAKAKEFGADYIAQGTLYTDNVESGLGHRTGARRARIKQHHNTNLGFSLPELTPLGDCVKDNARDIGRSIKVPEELLVRHPFPGPGLAIRIEGEVTREKLRIERAADGILIFEIRAAGLYEKIWQAGAPLTSSKHTTTKGDDAGTGSIVMPYAISSVNGFTARPYPLPWDVMELISDRMGNEIPEVGAVAFRTSGKPYSTIEME